MFVMTRFAPKAAQIAVLGFALMTAGAALAEGEALDPAMQETLNVQMTSQGYEVRKMQMEDGMIEVYAVKDGATYEMYYGADLALIKSCTDGVCTDASGAEVSGEAAESN